MGNATISWTTSSATYLTDYTHTRVRVLNGSTGEVTAQQFVPLPGTSAMFTDLLGGTYSADICLSNASGSSIDSGGVIGAGIFSIVQQFALPKPVTAVVAVS